MDFSANILELNFPVSVQSDVALEYMIHTETRQII